MSPHRAAVPFFCGSAEEALPTPDPTAAVASTTIIDFAQQMDELCTDRPAVSDASTYLQATLDALERATNAEGHDAYRAALDDAEKLIGTIMGAMATFEDAAGQLDAPVEAEAPLADYVATIAGQLDVATQALREVSALSIIAAAREGTFTPATDGIEAISADIDSIRTEIESAGLDAARVLGADSCAPRIGTGGT